MRFLRFDRPGIAGLMPAFLRDFRNELLAALPIFDVLESVQQQRALMVGKLF
jgi:hypothetical protein